MTGLLVSDPHHWAPVPQVVDYVASLIPEGARVLEIGPGHAPFRRATHFVDYVQRGDLPITICDVANDPLPFADKSFDFIYCRHVLEDMFNPFPLIREMSRVGHAGYIETPSPIAELCRGVDGGAPPYRGYHHHRFIVWVQDGQLRFVSKYPMVEYLNVVEDEWLAIQLAVQSRWNTYYLWRDSIDWKHRQNDLDFNMVQDYPRVLQVALHHSWESTNEFWSPILDAMKRQQGGDVKYTVSIGCGCGGRHSSTQEWAACPMAMVPLKTKHEIYYTDA